MCNAKKVWMKNMNYEWTVLSFTATYIQSIRTNECYLSGENFDEFGCKLYLAWSNNYVKQPFSIKN